MLIDQLKTEAKTQIVNIFFDMDGTLVEYDCDTQKLRLQPGSNYYTNKRPLTYMIEKAKQLFLCPNIEVHILTNCNLVEQIEQKTNWLARFMPFLKPENIHIICYQNLSFTSEEKPKLKGNFIKNLMQKDQKYYLIEDDLNNISHTNKFDGIKAFHISNLID